MKTLVITPKSKQSAVFLKKLLSKLNDVKSIEEREEKKVCTFFSFIRKFSRKRMEQRRR